MFKWIYVTQEKLVVTTCRHNQWINTLSADCSQNDWLRLYTCDTTHIRSHIDSLAIKSSTAKTVR